jgi:type II secretory pathway component GspD/PulD (secretin)
VTPQITAEGIVTLSLSPAVTLASPSNGSAKDRRPAAVRESDMLARVADGETIVTAGFTRERTTRERKAAGNKGGWFGRSTVVTRRHVALVILLTPRIVSVAGTE